MPDRARRASRFDPYRLRRNVKGASKTLIRHPGEKVAGLLHTQIDSARLETYGVARPYAIQHFRLVAALNMFSVRANE